LDAYEDQADGEEGCGEGDGGVEILGLDAGTSDVLVLSRKRRYSGVEDAGN
jgi:hypothetical protein